MEDKRDVPHATAFAVEPNFSGELGANVCWSCTRLKRRSISLCVATRGGLDHVCMVINYEVQLSADLEHPR